VCIEKIRIEEVKACQPIAEIHSQIPEFVSKTAYDFKMRCQEVKNLKIVAYYADQPAGYAVAYDRFKDGTIYFWMAGVIPEFRKKGVMTAMFNYRCQWGRENKFNLVKIQTKNKHRTMLMWLVKNGFDFIKVELNLKIQLNRIWLQKNL